MNKSRKVTTQIGVHLLNIKNKKPEENYKDLMNIKRNAQWMLYIEACM